LIRIAYMLAICLFTAVAWADGCYMPQQAVLKIPEIPAQRAIVSWKDGTETLLIASALDSESQKLGWVIPLPSVPETIDKASPGVLKTLSSCLQPEITHDLYPSVFMSIIVVALATLITAMVLFWKCSLVEILTVLLILFVLSSGLFPAISTAGPTRTTIGGAIEIEMTASVGAYDIAILRSKSVDGLKEWLGGNGFAALPAAAEITVANYIREGWVFAAVVLTRDEAGANAPHPIKIAFKVKEPVYPMRLTAVAGGNTELELFVIADKRASTGLLKTAFCDAFDAVLLTNQYTAYETEKVYSGRSTGLKLGHAALCDMMWPGCVITKLSGTIGSDKMADDIRFLWKPFKAYRPHLYTMKGAKSAVFLILLWGIGGVFLVSMILFKKRIREAHGFWPVFRKVIFPSSAAVVMMAAVFYMAVPKLEAAEFQVNHRRFGPRWLMSSFVMHLRENPSLLSGSEQEIANRLLGYQTAKSARSDAHGKRPMPSNRLTGGTLQVEDSPGNFTVTRQGDNVILRVYDTVGRAVTNSWPATPRVPLPPKAQEATP